MNTISLKPINLLKFAGTLMEMVHDIGLLEMIMNKCFTFLLLQDGSFHYYNTNGTFGDFGTTDEGRTFIIFHDKTNIIVHGESSGDVYFHMYNPLKDKWIKSVDSLFVENNNKLSFHDPKESKMYFFVGEDVLTIHSYKIVPLDNERERISNIMDAEYFAILVQNVEEVQMKGIPVTVKSSDYGLFIVFRKALQFYQFETGKLIDIPFSPSEFRSSEFRSTQFYVHPQTSDGIIISERGEVYIIDPRSEIILPIHIGTIQSPPNPYKIHFFYRYIIVTTTTTMIIYDIHNIKNYQTIQLEIDYDVNSIVVWNNPDVSIGFYSNKCKTFNEFLLSENTNYTNDMKNGLLPILLSNFQKTILNNTQMSTITISKFLDRLGNDLPLIIFLSTQSQYHNLLSMSNTWNIDQINSYFNELGIVDQPKEVIIPKPTKSWNPRCFNVADVTVQLSQSPTEEKVNKVYEMLHIEKIHGNLIIPDELITSLRNHKVNWFYH
ncbi:Mic1 domain-containing protein [Entamoeba marina]